MNFKLIDTIQLKNIYPNNYNLNILKTYKLYDIDFNTSFKYCYSYYKLYLDSYLNEVLNLNEIDQKINELSIQLDTNYLYNDISFLDSNYMFIRNNIFLDRLTEEEIVALIDSINQKNTKAIKEIVKNTFKKTIRFGNENDDKDVCYEIDNLKMITKNDALVIGVLVIDEISEDFKDFIKSKEQEFSNLLNIPVSIFLYQNKDINKSTIYNVINLNELEDQRSIEELKKYPKYLPVGSVVMLKGAWKKLMITGFAPIDPETKEIIYDYMACLYPEGVLDQKHNILFNHENIKKIYAIGLIDEEQKQFMKMLFNQE